MLFRCARDSARCLLLGFASDTIVGIAQMSTHNMVVVGASAGGVEALSDLFWDLPSSLPISFFVTLHRLPHGPSWLPAILKRTAGLPAEHPCDGENRGNST